MIAYNERIIRTSGSEQRRDRARQMLANLQPFLRHFEMKAALKLAPATARTARVDGQELVSTWNGRDSLDTLHPDIDPALTRGLGSSLSGVHAFGRL